MDLFERKEELEEEHQMIGCSDSTFCGSEIQWNAVRGEDINVSGVFEFLINEAAFVDKLVLGIHGRLRKRMPRSIEKKANLAIGGPGRPYARSLHGIHLDTGNQFEVKYGRNRTYRNLFDAKFTARSESVPLSWQDVAQTLDCLFRKGAQISVNGLELTWDVSVPFRYFKNHIVTKTHSIRTLIDDQGRQTLYAGSPGADWMLRVYQKTKATTRVELVFRRSFLAKIRIDSVGRIACLDNLKWDRLVRFPTVCPRALERLVAGKVTAKQLQLILDWPERRPIGMLLEILRGYGLQGDQILRVSPVEELLWKMLKSFSWCIRGVEAPEE